MGHLHRQPTPSAQQEDQNQMGALAGSSTNVGERGTTGALNYDMGILSGDPTKVAQTMSA